MALVLVVDDEANARELLGQLIARQGHEVIETPSADAALSAMAARVADVVFTDIQMPGRDGRWLTLELRTRYPAVPVVLATSVTDLEPTMTLQFGVVSYVVKPFDVEAVRRALEMAIEWREKNAAPAPAGDGRQLEEWLNSLDAV